MLMSKGYKFRCYPTVAQEQQLRRDFNAARWAYNEGLDAIAFCHRALGRNVSWSQCSAAITALKRDPEYAWLNDANSVVMVYALQDLGRAFRNFFAGRAQFPKFKRKQCAQSVRYPLDQRNMHNVFNAATGLLRLPKLGTVKLNWSQPVAGIPKLVTVSRDTVGDYFVSLWCTVRTLPQRPTGNVVGVDAGLRDVAVTSDGKKSGNPKFTERYERQLKRAQQTLSRREKGSHRYEQARQRVAKIHRKIARCRGDFLHKQVTTPIVNNNDVIALETLCVKGIARGWHSKSVYDASLGEMQRQLAYKAKWAGKQVINIDRFTRSTGVCPQCGTVGPKLEVGIEYWTCAACGVHHDRDIAAAQVILAIAQGTLPTPRRKLPVRPKRRDR